MQQRQRRWSHEVHLALVCGRKRLEHAHVPGACLSPTHRVIRPLRSMSAGALCHSLCLPVLAEMLTRVPLLPRRMSGRAASQQRDAASSAEHPSIRGFVPISREGATQTHILFDSHSRPLSNQFLLNLYITRAPTLPVLPILPPVGRRGCPVRRPPLRGCPARRLSSGQSPHAARRPPLSEGR